MRPHVITGSIIAITTLLAAAPVAAQLYKWVDENGVTNYSNQPPANPKAAKNLRPVEDRLSVYSPDEGLTQAIDDARQKSQQRQSQRARIDNLDFLRRNSKLTDNILRIFTVSNHSGRFPHD